MLKKIIYYPFLFFFSISLVLLLCIANTAFAQSRTKISINDLWQFHKGDIEGFPLQDNKVEWQLLSLPHTWNAEDTHDDVPGYYRDNAWYRKNISISPSLRDREVFLYFEGANQETEVFINGQKAGVHIGGYTRFCIPISKYLKFAESGNGINEIAIKVTNRFNEDIPTLTADFTFFGGIYRDVYLISTNPVHFDLSDHASNGIYITTPAVTEENASVHIKGKFVNNGKAKGKVKVISTIWNADKQKVSEVQSLFRLKPDKIAFEQDIKSIVDPKLWSPENPYLYTVTTQLVDQTGQILDEVNNPLGFRWFRFDAKEGFFLNGKHYKLIGASRHQDFEGMGNAVPDALQIEDVKLLKEMGGNFLRVAHYPQDPVILETCDKLGILASVEVPIVNTITESEAFYENCKNMHLEMIRQNFNHPSVIIWAYMNEILLRPKFREDKPRQEKYFQNITNLAQEIENITRKEDPSRYTMIPNHGSFDLYRRVKLTEIPMLVGWNLYQGWYSSGIEGFAEFLDKHRRELPDKPLLVTEYGADADPRIRSFTPERFDKSVEYANYYHEVYLREMLDRPFVAAAMIWNLADFSSETREESMPHINNKGITQWDRTPKDPYYYYQAFLLKEPLLKIASREWIYRSGIADQPNGKTCTRPIKTFTNLKKVTLIVNGKIIGEKNAENRVCEWQVPFVNGTNTIEVVGNVNGKAYRDYIEIEFDLQPYFLSDSETPFQELNVLLGAKRIFIEETTHTVWLPDQPYEQGSWGHIGGESFKIKNSGRQSYGTDKNILGTDNDPIYQTQHVNIEQYKLDLPAGQYELTLHFAELVGGGVKEALPYNLDNSVRQEESEVREFDVFINDLLVLENFNIANEFGFARGVAHKMEVTVKGNKGITIKFRAKKGEPVLNALQVRKKY
ncbi:MAG TPA: glycoside hydrolase family 2 TIM barrel-domain containing protein [Cytophagales bacterium]|nr:glycoside hydrolase family 2 TIM barrel-domain containing protein [Cytophagales bacterium]